MYQEVKVFFNLGPKNREVAISCAASHSLNNSTQPPAVAPSQNEVDVLIVCLGYTVVCGRVQRSVTLAGTVTFCLVFPHFFTCK